MHDLYPSRRGAEVEISRRKDPVIHAGSSQKDNTPLTEEQLNSYEKNGYLLLQDFFPENDLKMMQHEMQTIQEEFQTKDAPEIIREPASDQIRSVFAIHQKNDLFKKISSDQRLLDIVTHLLGSEVYVNQSRINYKPGFTGKEYWHSDFETWHVEDGMPRMRAVSVSIALSDHYIYNGPLMLIPSSHRYFVSCMGGTHKGSLKKKNTGMPDPLAMGWFAKEFGIDVPTGPAGSVLLFECNTMHGSNGNITPFDRNNLFMVYNSVENRLTDPFSGGTPRPEFIAAREPEPVFG